MTNKQIQIKRQQKTGFRKLHARVTQTSRRKQRVSTAANPHSLDSDVPNASIGRALTVILMLHLVAIGVIYIGIKWNKGDFNKVEAAPVVAASVASREPDLSNLNADLKRDYAMAGDTYESFAARHKVDVDELRKVNGNTAITAGKTLYLPAPMIKATPVTAPVSDRPALPASSNVVKTEVAAPAIPKAIVVNPNVEAPAASVQEYKVQPGDSVWRISNKFKVSQKALMELNGMKDARQLRSGVTLKIPAK